VTTFASPGAMTVDWEERVNPDRLRSYRFGRAKAALEASDLGAMLLFDFGAQFVRHSYRILATVLICCREIGFDGYEWIKALCMP
jgi:hypothetical protein